MLRLYDYFESGNAYKQHRAELATKMERGYHALGVMETRITDAVGRAVAWPAG